MAGAYRNMLLLLMVLALADAQTFTVFGLVTLEGESARWSLFLFGAAVALVVGFVGLFRLALWGVLVNVVTCAVVLVACLLFFDDARRTLRQSVVILGAVHVLVGAPVIVAVLKGARIPSLPARVRAFAMTSGIVLLVALAASRAIFQW